MLVGSTWLWSILPEMCSTQWQRIYCLYPITFSLPLSSSLIDMHRVFMLGPTQAFLVLLSPVTTGTSALEVYTPKEIFVANGTQGKLTCKFKSTNTTGTLTSVSWSFQPEGTDTTVSVGTLASCCWAALPRSSLLSYHEYPV